MKSVVILTFLFSFTFLFSQTDNILSTPQDNINSFGLPGKPSLNNAGLPIYNNPEGLVKPQDNFSFETEQFDNPGEKYNKTINKSFAVEEKKDKGREEDLYFGDFTTSSRTAVIIFRDHGQFDGDRIRVYNNDIILKNNILLESAFKSFTMSLDPGFNKIEFEALNQGSLGANTAEFIVYDEKGEILFSNQWRLQTGVKASLIVVKE